MQPCLTAFTSQRTHVHSRRGRRSPRHVTQCVPSPASPPLAIAHVDVLPQPRTLAASSARASRAASSSLCRSRTVSSRTPMVSGLYTLSKACSLTRRACSSLPRAVPGRHKCCRADEPADGFGPLRQGERGTARRWRRQGGQVTTGWCGTSRGGGIAISRVLVSFRSFARCISLVPCSLWRPLVVNLDASHALSSGATPGSLELAR